MPIETAARTYGLKALWWAGERLAMWLLPYMVPILLFLGALAWKWAGMLWRLLGG